MKLLMVLVLLTPMLSATDDPVARGAVVYRGTCGVAYCHGPEGKAGRAPAIAGRFDAQTVAVTAAMGIPNTGMPSFAKQLKPEDIEAVAAYIASLGTPAPAGPAKPPAAIPAETQKGRALFFDAGRTGACGSCHEVGGLGVPVSLALQDLRRARVADLRAIATPELVTARPSGEDPFPAVVAEKTLARVRVYDISSRLPVLRTFTPGEVTLTPGAAWNHGTAAALYTNEELAAIAGYLRWASEQ